MIAWGRHNFALDRADDKGVTERAHVESLLKVARTSERIAELEAMLHGPALPDCLSYLVEWFNEVGPCLSSGFGPVPLTFSEISAWAALRRIDPTPWDVTALRALSDTFCAVQNEKA